MVGGLSMIFGLSRLTRCGKLSSFDRPSPRALAITTPSLRRRSRLPICLISCSRSIRLCQISSGDNFASVEMCVR